MILERLRIVFDRWRWGHKTVVAATSMADGNIGSFRETIAAFGRKPMAFAKAIGIPASHARVMKKRNSIPPLYWPRVVEAAEAKQIEGITLTTLSALYLKRWGEPAREAAR